ncbi:periplasmic nitrate reductase, NapE protein, partial [Escherichia ruysiae]
MIDSATETDRPKHRKRDEIIAFLILAVVIWPILSVAIVGGYG